MRRAPLTAPSTLPRHALHRTPLSGNVGDMTTGESRRHDLYNGLTEFLGADRADTLMAYLPPRENSDLATRWDIDALTSRIDGVETSLAARIDGVNQRLDRIVLTLAAGLIAIIATLISQVFG